jgi:TPR repeat protein
VLGREVARHTPLDAAEKKAQAAGQELHARAFEIATKSCEQGDSEACDGVAGVMAAPHAGLPADPVRAQALSKRAADLRQAACQRGERDGCAQVRYSLLYGHDTTDRDRERGIVLMKQACSAGDPVACGEWAGVNHTKWVAQQRTELTVEEMFKLSSKACDGDITFGCRIAAGMSRFGHGTPVDLQAAERMYEKVCFATGEECDKLVEVHEEAASGKR